MISNRERAKLPRNPDFDKYLSVNKLQIIANFTNFESKTIYF
ncbi:hypothetical protein HMPREF0645_2281 [Hallella bergensis DSM 17361]|uniref:Uncharacterized protein n=1 Tax=Hallella bergensis DSM 17361 TaxID=585502 RepID=D1PZ96_9BACT|nr:hypothetical protein HMPREF0645_2281 [Hallella bergensis DSM 17361]